MTATDRKQPQKTNGNGNGKERSALYLLGCNISAWVSDVFAHPSVQLGFILLCIGWFVSGLSTDLLTAALSIMAITLTQMVLNRQNEREAEAHRRDVAMHAKLDELIIAVTHAHNELAGIEELPEEVIVELKEETLAKLTEATDEPDEAHRRMPTDAKRSRSAAK
ncbi:low affinity iron permease family protein [Sphingomonas sp. NSE70-1]|uniref:Low affinity iron permease family protein n=1 Tax=Sphingomonas caseinilyticus TaxID=2908205 RepID=A0ABT0RW98_9SPHN|nr:low affinity iron permease family protein [Sphingomonas caseinilyticus]MCL6699186.1 low affinity iron permease family protein [Sphingomonas caseinilyticus]